MKYTLESFKEAVNGKVVDVDIAIKSEWSGMIEYHDIRLQVIDSDEL